MGFPEWIEVAVLVGGNGWRTVEIETEPGVGRFSIDYPEFGETDRAVDRLLEFLLSDLFCGGLDCPEGTDTAYVEDNINGVRIKAWLHGDETKRVLREMLLNVFRSAEREGLLV